MTTTEASLPRRTAPAGIAVSPLMVSAFRSFALTGASTPADDEEIVDVISSGSAVPAGIVTSRYSGRRGAGAADSAGRLLLSRGGNPTAGALLYDELAGGADSVRDGAVARDEVSRRPTVARGAVVDRSVRTAELSADGDACCVSAAGAGATV